MVCWVITRVNTILRVDPKAKHQTDLSRVSRYTQTLQPYVLHRCSRTPAAQPHERFTLRSIFRSTSRLAPCSRARAHRRNSKTGLHDLCVYIYMYMDISVYIYISGQPCVLFADRPRDWCHARWRVPTDETRGLDRRRLARLARRESLYPRDLAKGSRPGLESFQKGEIHVHICIYVCIYLSIYILARRQFVHTRDLAAGSGSKLESIQKGDIYMHLCIDSSIYVCIYMYMYILACPSSLFCSGFRFPTGKHSKGRPLYHLSIYTHTYIY